MKKVLLLIVILIGISGMAMAQKPKHHPVKHRRHVVHHKRHVVHHHRVVHHHK